VTKLSEKKRLVLTVAVIAALTAGLVALIFSDRGEIEGVEEEISSLDQRIDAADVEIRKTKDREDRALVFRAVEKRELAVLPEEQKIADFHRNLSTFLISAGLKFQELPESHAVESDLAKGIYVTRSQVSCRGDSASLLKFLNMLENDPRLVAVKGLKIESAPRTRNQPEGTAPLHDIDVHLETYFYNPATGAPKAVTVPSEDRRLQEPAIRDAIASFQPERPDTYVLRPAVSRRDPLVDPRKARVKEDPAAQEEMFKRQESVVIEIENGLADIEELLEQEKAFIQNGDLFRRDRLANVIDGKTNELGARIGQVDQMKTVTVAALAARVQDAKIRLDEARSRRTPRDLSITVRVAQATMDEIQEAFGLGDYTEVASVGSAWAEYLRGKQVEPEARPILEAIQAVRSKAKTYGDFTALGIRVSGILVDHRDPRRSVAIINNRTFQTGDKFDDQGEILVGEITKSGVDFHYRDEVIHKEQATGPASPGPAKPKSGPPARVPKGPPPDRKTTKLPK
jgi:hypothetical protein